MPNHVFTKKELIEIFDNVIGCTLGEVDKNNVFNKTILNPKITGIAGDVIEQSVLGYPADNKQEADLIVDGIDTELKTTGLKISKKGIYSVEAKEPMSITAVSPNKIVEEEFYSSMLWHKMEHMLLIYYLYDSETTVPASEYAKFPIQNYQFHEFSKEDIEILLNDWQVVRDFIINVKENNLNPSIEYPKISKLRNQMLYMDTAPKYPHPPRFRLRRQTLTTIVQKFLGKEFQPLYGKNKFSNYKELDEILENFTIKYKDKSIEEIARILDLELVRNSDGKVNKSITEKIMTAAFGIKSGKLRKIDTFAKIGTIPKTLTLTNKGARTEDTKFDTIDFLEWSDPRRDFECSSIYEFFANQTLLFSIFEEAYNNSPLEKNIFKGFKRLSFDDEFINSEVKKTWDQVRYLLFNNKFKVEGVRNKNGELRLNKKTGTIQEATNFPKSKDYAIFLRGTSTDSTKKPLKLNGYDIYQQQFWIKGTVLVEMLNKIDYV